MTKAPSREVRLFGTDEQVKAPILLEAGPLSAELEAGNLRYIRYDGREMIRAISFIVRDRNWGTYQPEIDNLEIAESGESFRVTYDAVAGDAQQQFRYSAVIVGKADGSLRFAARGRAATDFLTNRTGFVVLHPIENVAGEPASIEQVDGKRVETRFPGLIDPVQPMMNLRAITHAFAPGARVKCLMEGDTFEMEDQRNWTDASYKTYVRPLALPWPYTLAAGTELEQAVSLSIEGKPSAGGAKPSGISVSIEGESGTAPALGVGLAPEDAASVMAKIDVLRKMAPAHVICHHDPRRGHDRRTLETAIAAARALGAVPWLEAVVASVEGWEQELSALAATVAAMGSPFPVVMLSPAPDLKCVLPGTPWPPCPPAGDLFRLARRAFPGARIGGGMFSYFTELNRKRPPHELLDFVSFTTSALVHAGDDRSVAEGIEALPYIARSVGAFAGGKPYAVGPSAIGMRDNPYGAKTMDNLDDLRQAMNRNDPRQRGLLGAAWNLAYFARFAYGGAEAVALGGLTGPFGVLHSRAAWPQAWYDATGGLYPVYHVLRGMAALKGARLREVRIGAPREVQAIAARTGGGTDLWLANLTGSGLKLNLEGIGADARIRLLDAGSFVTAASDPDALVRPSDPVKGSSIELDAYAVAHLRAEVRGIL